MEQETIDFFNSIKRHIKFGNRISPPKEIGCFTFMDLYIYEADEHHSYKDRVGQRVVAYAHGWFKQDGTFKVEKFFDFVWKKNDRIEILSSFNPQHFEI